MLDVNELIPNLDTINSICLEAGSQIVSVYKKEFYIEFKDDKSPLTEADRLSHNVIVSGLEALPTPWGQLPILSEEAKEDPYETRKDWSYWWLIDPLDGTKEFIKKNGEFTVNIALMKQGREEEKAVPIAGWVYAPILNTLYYGVLGHGAYRQKIGEQVERLPLTEESDELRIIASRSHRSAPVDELLEVLEKQYKKISIKSAGSSLKLCLVAEGSADLYPRPAPTCEWDTAAADAICRASGASVLRVPEGDAICYGKKNLLNPWFFVGRNRQLLDITTDVLKHSIQKQNN